MPDLDEHEVLAAQQQPQISSKPTTPFPPIPQTSKARLDASIHDQALDVDALVHDTATTDAAGEPLKTSEKTILYLAYGSNLSSATFRKTRGIVPLSQVCVYVPDLTLTFDLPGLPYLEPSFAGTAFKNENASPETYTNGNANGTFEKSSEKESLLNDNDSDLNPLWPKPLVGVVYEVTLSDYAHIIATEGGGSSYIDVLIDCHPFPDAYDPSSPVPMHPPTRAFKAHTLLSPQANKDPKSHTRRKQRYPRPSARYKNLLVTGAREHDLPVEYRAYLEGFPAYEARTRGQRVGRVVFGMLWGPMFLFFMVLARRFADENGRAPGWAARGQKAVFEGVWWAYDVVFRRVFGDGER